MTRWTPETFPYAPAMAAYTADPHAQAFQRDTLLACMFCCGAFPFENFDAAWGTGKGESQPGAECSGPWIWSCYLYVLEACEGRETITADEFGLHSIAYSQRSAA